VNFNLPRNSWVSLFQNRICCSNSSFWEIGVGTWQLWKGLHFQFFFLTSTDFLLLGGSPGEVAEPLEDWIFLSLLPIFRFWEVTLMRLLTLFEIEFLYLFFHFYRLFAFGGVIIWLGCWISWKLNFLIFFFTSTDFLLLGDYQGEFAAPVEDWILFFFSLLPTFRFWGFTLVRLLNLLKVAFLYFFFHFYRLFVFGGLPLWGC
jgi:hypothetical protein